MKKELKIEVPQGYEIDKEKSTFEKIDIFDDDDNAIFLGKKRELLEKLYASQILSTKTISQTMIVGSTIVINVK